MKVQMKTHIFLIDDDIDEMKLFVEAMKEVIAGFKCTYASSGAQALKMLLYLRPEVIFIDYNMPLMNGLELAEELKKSKELKDIPLFLYSTHISSNMLQKARELGIAQCIEKPCTMNEMIQTLKIIFTGEGKFNLSLSGSSS